MPQNSIKKELLDLEKLVKKILRKSLKDNTLDYTIQFTMSSMEPGEAKYAAQISAPAKGVQPITFIFDNLNDLRASLEQATKSIDKKQVEITYHESRINTFESKIQQHKNRIETLNDPDYDPESDAIEMEEVS